MYLCINRKLVSILIRDRWKCRWISLQSENKEISDSHQNMNEDAKNSARLLEILNNKSVEDLMRYPITKRRLEKIQAWKTTNGKFESIDQLFGLGGFGGKMFEKFCTSILQHDENPILKNKIAGGSKAINAFTIPTLLTSSRELYRSCVSIFINVSSIAWARIELSDNAPCQLSHWQHYDIPDKRLHLTDLVQHCRYINRLIPDADCYILENPQVAQGSAAGSAEQININVQKAQLIAVLNYSLASRIEIQSNVVRIFYLKRFLSSKVFNTLVGTERISSEEIVLELIRTHYNYEYRNTTEMNDENNDDDTALQSKINVPFELRSSYNDAEKYQRDYLGQALLIGMAFIRLCLLRTPESLAKVSSQFKNDI